MVRSLAAILVLTLLPCMAQIPSTTAKQMAHASLPPNSLRIPVGHPLASDITKDEFDRILKKIRDLHQHFFKEMNARLKIKSDWEDGTVNAFADRDFDVYIIEVYGGLARHPTLTRDGFALLVCHELGHHIGGAPTGENLGWPSIEGQSDYFATLKCLRRVFADEDNEAALRGQALDPIAKQKCESAFPDRKDQLVCERSALASWSAARLLHELVGKGAPPEFSTPDTHQVPKTDTEHPDAQCRLDTYFAGAICQANAERNPGVNDPREGTCYEGRETEGFRPRCWFKP